MGRGESSVVKEISRFGMLKKHHVPEFGKWDNDDDIPYTQYFDTALTNKSKGKATNLTECPEIPSSFSSDVSPVQVRAVRRSSNREIREAERLKSRESHEVSGFYSDDSSPVHVLPTKRWSSAEREIVHNKSREYGDVLFNKDAAMRNLVDHWRHPSLANQRGVRSSSNSPIRRDDLINPRIGIGRLSPVSRRHFRTSDQVFSKESSHAHSINTSNGSRPMLIRQASESSDQSSSVPRFGDGYMSDPSSTDGFTQSFQNAREDKPSVPVKVPAIPARVMPPPRAPSRKPDKRSKSPDCSRCFCFANANK